MDIKELFKLHDRTRRAEVNFGFCLSVSHLSKAFSRVIELTRIVETYNFDARDVSREMAVEYLTKTLELTELTKDALLSMRRELDNAIFNMDYYTRRCKQDLDRYRRDLSA